MLCRGEERDLARLNINLRCGARVLLVLASFRATDFETLFQGTRAVRWEDWVPREGEFPVTGYSINSTLHSVPACQSIVKKAVVERLGAAYGLQTLPETGKALSDPFLDHEGRGDALPRRKRRGGFTSAATAPSAWRLRSRRRWPPRW